MRKKLTEVITLGKRKKEGGGLGRLERVLKKLLLQNVRLSKCTLIFKASIKHTLLPLLWFYYLLPLLTPQALGLQLLSTCPKPCCCYLVNKFPGKNTGVGCYFLLQGIFLTQDRTCVSSIGSWILYH